MRKPKNSEQYTTHADAAAFLRRYADELESGHPEGELVRVTIDTRYWIPSPKSGKSAS